MQAENLHPKYSHYTGLSMCKGLHCPARNQESWRNFAITLINPLRLGVLSEIAFHEKAITRFENCVSRSMSGTAMLRQLPQCANRPVCA